MKFNDITVLMSACGSPSIPGMIRCLKENGERNIRVVGVDMDDDPTTKYLVDVFYRVRSASAPEYCDVVLEICRKENVDVYFPNISAEVSAVVARQEEFTQLGVKLSVSNLESIEISNNKLRAYESLKQAGITVPEYYPVHSVEDFVSGCQHMGYPEKPVCLKIVDGSGSRGVRIIDSKISRYDIFAYQKPNSSYTSYEDMLSVLKSAEHLDEMMLVECMKGPEYTVDLLAADGEVIYIAGRENVDSLMSIAQKSIVKRDELAYQTASQIVKALNMSGNVGFDFMRNEAGEAVLMDINPRITATVSVIAAAGLNLIYMRVKQLMGEELPEVNIDYGTFLRRRYLETFTDSKGGLIR
jgi:carbamoyl-phosphate synthase large subunit